MYIIYIRRCCQFVSAASSETAYTETPKHTHTYMYINTHTYIYTGADSASLRAAAPETPATAAGLSMCSPILTHADVSTCTYSRN